MEARADPNVVIGQGEVRPLVKAIVFARDCDVAAMRDLLLEHGAAEDAIAHQHWLERAYSNRYDGPYVRNVHRDDREG